LAAYAYIVTVYRDPDAVAIKAKVRVTVTLTVADAFGITTTKLVVSGLELASSLSIQTLNWALGSLESSDE
jgi:uncharacterized membrane protein YbaN (DUF454 family)